MTIQSVINQWVATGELRYLRPSLPSIQCVRSIFVTEEVEAALIGPWPTTGLERRFGRASATLDAFTEGLRMSVRLPPSKSVLAQIALLEDAEDEVWEIRVSDPRPGVRVFGRFSDRDCFIAMTWSEREKLITDDDWRREKERCKREWRKLFPSFNPHTGTKADDYVSNAFSV